MSESVVPPSDATITATSHINLSQSIDGETFQTACHSKEPPEGDRKPQQFDLTQKISSLATYNDPFKSIYLRDWNAQTTLEAKTTQEETKPIANSFLARNGSTSTATLVGDLKSEGSSEEEVAYINGKFQNLTLQRVLALRKVQNTIKYAPNPSAVGADSTAFSEDDLVALTMEELQALQKRKRDIGKDIQPLSVVKVSIQAERSRKRLEPRDYQIELYERARRENTIAVLGTGTGKTLIACLLIRDILVQERLNRVAGKKVLSKEVLNADG